MPVTPTYPGVYIEEPPSAVHTITAVSTSVTAFVGYTPSGPLETPQTLTSFADFERTFGGLWLDSTMTYSSALFESPEKTLEEAQLEKYRRILRQIDAQPGQKILEIGCGWGGFAEVATLEFGCHVRGLTLSPSQREWAIRRASD